MRLLGLFLLVELLFGHKKPKLPVALEQILRNEAITARAHVGMRVVEIRTGNVLYERNPQSWFVPASNTKLYSTALALTKLGAAHRFETQVVADGKDLRLIGGADPTLSGRSYPYNRDAEWRDGAGGIEELADALVAKGLKVVEGSVIGDDTRYLWDPIPPGWGADDGLYEYGAPVSALMLNDNAIRVKIRPGAAAGQPAELALNPAVEYFAIQNRVVTAEAGSPARIRFERPIGTREVWLEGTIALGATETEEILAVDEPARFAAQALVDALRRRGVEVRGGAGVRHRFEGDPMPCDRCEVLASRQSPPLGQIIQVVNKVSQNLHAEIMRREGGGEEQMKALFAAAGVPDEDTYLVDGSGLSRLTLVCPESSTKILLHLWNSPEREAWLQSLPIGAQDGTLENRFKGFAEAGRVKAKTGTLTHVAALAGYLDHPKRGMLAFSVMVNNFNGPSAKARAVIDRLVMTLLDY